MPSKDDVDVQTLLSDQLHEEAFELLLSRYGTKVFHLSYSFVRDRGAAEDLTQETFLKLWRALAKYDGRASFSTWIYAITRNSCFTYLKRRGRREALSLAEPLVEAAADRVRHQSPAGTSGLECERLLALLSEDQRKVVTLFYLEGRSCEEVAVMLDVAPGTVRSRLHRARQAFAQSSGARPAGTEDSR